MDYAIERSQTRWSQAYRAIMACDASKVTKEHCNELFLAIQAELWPDNDVVPDTDDAMQHVARFCKGVPAIVNIMRDLHGHLNPRFQWNELQALMR